METYGKILKGKPDKLIGYILSNLRITDKNVIEKSGKEIHPVAIKTSDGNDSIEGIIFEISEKELVETDKYEVSDYERVLETFKSGREAWIYTGKPT